MTESYDFPEPIHDFSLLTLEELRSINTNHKEIISVLRSTGVAWRTIPGHPLKDYFFFVIGRSSNSRFLLVALNYYAESHRYIYHQVKLADDEEIKRLWCG